MAKRFRDTNKWRGWYRELPPTIKLLFDYLCDECNHAGVWKEDYTIASACIGAAVTREDVEKYLNKHVVVIDADKVFIPSFVEFQYSVGKASLQSKLNPSNKAHNGIIKELLRNGIDPTPWIVADSKAPSKPLVSPFVAPAKPLPRGTGVGIGIGIGIGEEEKGGVGEKTNSSAPTLADVPSNAPPADSCAYCEGSGEVFTRSKADDRERRFRCSCGQGNASSGLLPWSPLFLGDFELLRFNGPTARWRPPRDSPDEIGAAIDARLAEAAS